MRLLLPCLLLAEAVGLNVRTLHPIPITITNDDADVNDGRNPTHIAYHPDLGAYVHFGRQKVFNDDATARIRNFILEIGICDIINYPEFDIVSEQQREDIAEQCMNFVESSFNNGLSEEEAIRYLEEEQEVLKSKISSFIHHLLNRNEIINTTSINHPTTVELDNTYQYPLANYTSVDYTSLYKDQYHQDIFRYGDRRHRGND